MDLGLRNIADANFIDRAAVPFACHDDLLLLAEVEGKTSADYRDDPSGVKGLAKIFSILLRHGGSTRAGTKAQSVAVTQTLATRYGVA
jgi:hypothetical protein